MTNDKLNSEAESADARAIAIYSIDDDAAPLRALDEAIRAKLMHVSIGVGGSGSQVVRLLVDLSVYVSFHEAQMRAKGSLAHDVIVLHEAALKATIYDTDAHVWCDTNMMVPQWSYVATQGHVSNLLHTDPFPVMGEPMTLRLLFDAQTRCGASQLAERLCSRFSAWHAVTTSLKEAMSALRSTLMIPNIYSTARCERMVYVSGAVSRGWHDRIVDPAHFLRSSFEEGAWREPRLAAPVAELCKQRFEAVWHETAKTFQEQAPKGDEASETDSEPGGDAADDYVCASRMTSLWYGSKRRRLRKG